jgi:hypothetical protein
MVNRIFKNKLTRGLAQDLERISISTDIGFWKIAKQLAGERKILLSFREMWNLYDGVRKTARLSGDIAELGVFSGGSAKLICQAKGNRRLHLFDTFAGLPSNNYEINKINQGDINGGALKEVRGYLSEYSGLYFYEGIFPYTTVDLKRPVNFSFIHLDADIYEATLEGLKFFYPIMVKSGIILIHDYNAVHLPGVKRAVNEFLKDKPEKIVNLRNKPFSRYYLADQAMIVKQ